MVAKLFHMTHSPWSQKARCALAHHGVQVEPVEYHPFVGEPMLRLRLALAGEAWTGRLGVPVLIAPDGVATNSWDIVCYADRVGAGPALVPEELAADVQEWNARSDRMLEAARARFMVRVVEDEAATRELLPPALARAPRTLLRVSMRAFERKWGIRAEDGARHLETIEQELVHLRAALAGGAEYLLGTLSYADFAMAIALQAIGVRPGTGFGPRSASISGEPPLASAFSDLLEWRDRCYAEHACLR